ncbi:MAG: alginate lyase family protein [Candidatus Marinimicrobia bacterium]|nr:alginate lyase family protein [Candidatus Neomarinimicrobiota bacterium]
MRYISFILTVLLLIIIGINACAPQPESISPPATTISVFNTVLNHKALAQAKSGIEARDSLYVIPFQLLEFQVGEAMELSPPSVMDKENPPPSGDMHDYTSMGPYWWPDPDAKGGLPYIRRDGVVNPERAQFDKVPGATMAEAVRAFILMYYFTGDEKYAQKATEFLKVWFLNPKTRMNPNLNYGQFIPGRSDGRSVGIIESRNFVFLTEYEPLLKSSTYWTDADHEQFKSWMTEFLDWLLTSELGQEEQARVNNHGSWCDYQLLALSQYCGNHEVGREVAASIQGNRLEKQIEESGQQPEELERTKSYSYSVFNLSALVRSAILADNYDIDLSHHNGGNSALKQAIDYLIPYALGEKNWEHTQISSMDGSNEKMIFLLAYSQSKWPDERYKLALKNLSNTYPESAYLLTTQAFVNTNSGQKIEEKK